MDKVSIITTFYNAEKFIVNAIHSVAQQITTDDFYIEYVIVDDKSPDNSKALIENYFKNNEPVGKLELRVIEPEQNLGCGGARKFGIEHATGDYYMFLDADDYYLNRDFVKRAYETLKSENADIVEYGILFNLQNGNKRVDCVGEKIVCENNLRLAELLLFTDNKIKFNVWTKIYRRDIVMSYPYSTERTFEDVRTIPIWVKNARKIVIMPSIEINYRAASNSIIRSDMVNTRIGTITAIAGLFETFKDDTAILKAMYQRSMVDLEAILHNHSSNDEGFNAMSRLNTYMLKYIYPNNWQELTYHVEDDEELKSKKS
jgi:glycosyltransferase involved in cell wall biosynthesis